MGKLSFRPKSTVTFRGKDWRVVKAVSATELLLEDLTTRTKEVVDIVNLTTASEEDTSPVPVIESIDERDIAVAKRRLEIIRPLLDCSRGRAANARRIAAELGVGERTLRRWLQAYEIRGILSDLAPQRRNRAMPSRLDDGIEEVINRAIEELFLSRQKLSARKLHEAVKQRCAALKLAPPHETTLRKRLELLFCIQSTQLLLVHSVALPGQQEVKTPITKPAPLPSQIAQPLPDRAVVGTAGLVTHGTAIRPQGGTRPPLAHPVNLTQVSDGLPH